MSRYPAHQGDIVETTQDLVAGEPRRGFTVRAVLTGALVGGALSICNIYLGLKIGWGMNMSVTAALLAFGFWGLASRFGARSFGIGENNINQTGASAAAAISSAGLVAPIPAWTMLTGETLTYPQLTVWVMSVGLVGVVVGVGVRRQLIEVDKLPFPGGIATGQTLTEIYAKGAEAASRVRMLVGGMVLGGISKLVNVVGELSQVGLPFSLPASGAAAGKGVTAYSAKNLTLAVEPSALMVAVGAIIGPRASYTMLVGSVLSWGLLAPWVLDKGWASPGPADAEAVWFGPVVKWMLWPGVSMMVVASLTSFAFSWRSVLAALRPGGKAEGPSTVGDVGRPAYLASLIAVTAFAMVCQVVLFDIRIDFALLAVVLSFALAMVAGRVSGETNVTPVGAMGKVTQLTFGLLDPVSPAANLMTANVTGGSASQCADMLHDLKTGAMIGSWPKHQAVSQAVGVLSGAIVGSAAYLILIPDPKGMLLTEDWAAPAVATWKAVAEVFQGGGSALPEGAATAMAVAGVAGFVLAVLEKLVPRAYAKWVPSPASLGLSMTIQAYTAIAFAIGATIMLLGERFATSWTARFGLVLAAGVLAGESLAGVVDALWKIVGG